MSIVRRSGKITAQDVRSLKTVHLFTFLNRGYERFDALSALLVPGWLGAAPIIAGEGEPDVVMHGYEAEPGAWIFDDTDTGIGFLVLSDGLRPDAWRGSSIDVILDGRSPDGVPEAFERLVRKLVRSSGYYGFCKQDEVRGFVQEGVLDTKSDLAVTRSGK